ncbi:hypothetical protein LTR86_004703 [Recurvomyces mirabilis]|nr:hypothetical protein LTR86_004703 [Recurvomyces mirabilis]
MNSYTPGSQHSVDEKHAVDSSAIDGDRVEGNVDRDGLKLAKDGRTVLVPQPTDDPNDPLNWSWRKKHSVLLALAIISFIPDFGTAMGSVTQIPQAKQWHKPVNTIAESIAINTMLSGVSGIVVVALSSFFGRAPVMFWMRLIVLGAVFWYAFAPSYSQFYSARILVGFFVGVGQSGGLMWIEDMFFRHELPRKINIWSGFIIVSPYFGPWMANFVVWRESWCWVYYIYAIMNVVAFFVVCVFIDETYYDRRLPGHRQPAWRSRFLRLVGSERHGRESMLEAVSRPFIAGTKLPVLIITVYYFLNFAWVIGVNASTSVLLKATYHFNSKQTALFYFGPIVGSILSTILGHWVHDLFGRLYVRINGGEFASEARLWIIYVASPFTGMAIMLIGYALQRHWNVYGLSILLGVQIFGINIISTAVNAYLLDAYPEGSGEVDVWIVLGRTLGGMLSTYEQLPWVARDGTAKVFSIQAGITWASLVFVVVLQIWGRRIREWQGPMRFPGNERKRA